MTRISGYEFVINLDARQAINSINTFSNRVKVMKRVMEANFGELSRSVGSLHAYGQRLHDLARQEDEAMHAMEGHRKTLANQRAEQAKLRAEFEKGAKSQDQFRKGSDKLDNQIANTERRMANVQVRLAAINKDREESIKMIQRLSTGIDALTNHNDGLIRSYKTLETSLQESGKFYKANRVHVEGLQQSVKGLSKQYKAESLVLEQARSHHQELSAQYQKQSEIVAKLSAKKRINGKLTEKENADLIEAKGKMQGYTERMGESSKAIGEQTEQLHKVAKAMRDAQRAAGSFGSTKVGSFFKAAGSNINVVKENSQNLRKWAGDAKSTAVAVGGALASVGAGAGALVKKASDVQNKFIEVRNLMQTAGEGTKKSVGNMNKMMSQAVTLSTRYGTSQEAIGEQYKELIKRGYSGTAALGSMNAMLKAAKASGDDFADVVKVSSTVMDSFGLRVENANKMASNSARVNNAIASAADRTSTSFRDLGTGLAYVSGTAHNVGYSVEETAAALGELANRGMDGTRAGTGLRKVLTSLTGPTETADKALKSIGLSTKSFVDSKGDLLSIDKIFQLINSHLSGKTGAGKAAFYKAVFGATGMEAAQDLANTSAEVGKTDQSITALIKHIKQDESSNYINRLAKKNMQSTKNQLAAFKQTMWAMGIMIGKELMPTVNQVAKSLAKWVVSKEGRQSIQEVATMTKSIMTAITRRSSSIMNFFAGTIEGIHDVGKAARVVLYPVAKLFDFLSGSKGSGAKWMGRVAGWLLAGAAALKIFNGLFGWTFALGKDVTSMAKNGLFGSKLSEEQIQLAGINEQLGITSKLLQQINQNPIDPTKLSQDVSDASTYKANHGPVGPQGPGEPIIDYAGGAGEKATKEAAEKAGVKTAEEASESGAAKKAGEKIAEKTAEGIKGSGALARGMEEATEGVVKTRGLWSKGLAIGGKILNGVSYAFLAFDLSKSVIEMLTSASKKVRQSSAWQLGGAVVGGGLGMLVGQPVLGAAIGSSAGEGLGWLSEKSAHNNSKQAKANRLTGMGYGAVAGMGLGAPLGPVGAILGAGAGAAVGYVAGGAVPVAARKARKRRPILNKAQTKQTEDYARTIKKLGLKKLEWKVSVNRKSIQKAGTALEKMYRGMQKAADKASTARMKSEKKALDFALKSGLINKKQYTKAIQDIQKADSKRQQHNKNVTDKLVKETKAETKDRAKAYDDYYRDLKAKGISHETAEYMLNQKLRAIDSKYASVKKAKEKALTKALEANWNTSNNKQLSKMRSIVRAKGKLSEKEAGQLIKNSAKTAENTIRNANKQHDKTVASANSEYIGRVAALKKLRDDSKTISNSQYKALKKKAEDEKTAKINAADAARSGVVKQAREQHDKTIKYAETQNKEVSKHIVQQGNNSIDSYNAQASNATGVMRSILEAWNSVLKFFGQTPIPIAKVSATKSPHIGSSGGHSRHASPNVATGSYGSAHFAATGFATGGGVARNGLALVGEAGPELVYTPYADKVRVVGGGGAEFTHLRAGEQVLNARDTKRLMDGSYSGILPGYAKGTSTLGDWLAKIKKASDKIIKKIPKSIKNMLKYPVKWINNLFSTKWNAPKTAYPFLKIHEMVKLKDIFKSNVVKFLKGIFKKANNALDDAVESVANPGGAGVMRWKSYVAKALAANGIDATSYRIGKILATIQRESGGNPKAINLWDSNAKAGIPSKGLMQTIGPTFNAYKLKGHNDIYNGFDDLLAAINYIKHKYGTSDAAFARVAASGYANGGLVTRDQIARVAEGNNPEMIIPLSPLKRPRALQLTQQVISKFNAEAAQGVQYTSANVEAKLDILIDQFSTVLGQLKQVISNQNNPVPAVMGTAQAYSALNKYKKNKELKTKMLY